MKFYIASKTKHGPRWRELRDQGIPIISTWIDESEVGATNDFSDLWSRCINEAKTCDALIVYREPDEILKGGWCEVGAALAAGKPVYAVGCEEFTIRFHPLFYQFETFERALEQALIDICIARGL